MTTVHEFRASLLQGEEIPLSRYAGQVLLIVNTASKCGFTPQYEGLQRLYSAHRAQGLSVLAFPCNQFGRQEPADAAEICDFCRTMYGVTFPIFEKIAVNGPAAHPLYRFLKREKPGFFGTQWIKWNFTKFLVDRAGRVVARYSSLVQPASLDAAILRLLRSR